MLGVFISAAPVGAVPRYVNPESPKYLPQAFVRHIPSFQIAVERDIGWEECGSGGLVVSESTRIPLDSDFIQNITSTPAKVSQLTKETGLAEIDDNLQYHKPEDLPSRRITAEWFSKVEPRLASELVKHLTGQGWTADGTGGLVWDHECCMESYLPASLAQPLRSGADIPVKALLEAGWRLSGPGYYQLTRCCSPWLPITPKAIVEESAAAALEGAAIIHLHTRGRGDTVAWKLPWTTLPLVLGSQANSIEPTDYDYIIPRLRSTAPLAILNLSTSIRGHSQGSVDSDHPARRAHLKPYGPDMSCPEIASLSPGEVLFQTGGGYHNPKEFVEQQLSHYLTHAIRPEIEVFNWTILRETLGPLNARLLDAGSPPLIMLVAGVDQYRRVDGVGMEDDSLIPIKQRKQIFSLLQTGTPTDVTEALEITVAALAPIVQMIRRSLPTAKISTLMSGPMQKLLARVVVRLHLDGVRVGLEDGLMVSDPRVPGGVRKGRTAEQVRHLRQELCKLGCQVLSAEETRQALCMPTAAVKLFCAAMNATSHLLHGLGTVHQNPFIAVANALRPLRQNFECREQWLLQQLAGQVQGDTAGVPHLVRELLRQAGLHVRYFIEERDRYPENGTRAFRNIRDIQSLNYAYELLQEAGQDASLYERVLRDLALSSGISPGSFLVAANQKKSRDLRFFEYIMSLTCVFSADRSEVLNLGLRQLPSYSNFLAGLSKAIEWEYRRLYSISRAEMKSNGILAFWVGQDETYIALPDLHRQTCLSHWIVLPSTPTTNYPGGIRLSQGLGKTFSSHLERMLPPHCHPLRLIGLVHSGRDESGAPLVEASMLHSRFMMGTSVHTSIVGYPSRLLYEAIILPRLVEEPNRLLRSPKGTVIRDAGRPIYDDRTVARRVNRVTIKNLPPLRFLAHSSGISTLQQMDNAMRHDMEVLGFLPMEQAELFNRSVVVSFGSAADINVEAPGTPTVDITAYNDIRSMAGTTTSDYLIDDTHRRQQALAARDEHYHYNDSDWKIISSRINKFVLRRTGVYLREDPVRQHDGHSIRRYLEGAPEAISTILCQLHSTTGAARFDMALQQLVPV